MGTTHSQVEIHGQPTEAMNEQNKADDSVYSEGRGNSDDGQSHVGDVHLATADATITAAGQAAASSSYTESTGTRLVHADTWYARRGLTTRNTTQHTHPHMPSATANGATTMQNVESVHRQVVLEAGGGGLEPAPAPPPPQTRKRRSMEYIDWGAAHATSASMKAARALGRSASMPQETGLADTTAYQHTSLNPGYGGGAAKRLGWQGGAAQSYRGGIKKQEKSHREATNGGEINAEGKKKHEKQIEAGGGTATKKPSKCPGTWYGQGLAPINNLLLT